VRRRTKIILHRFTRFHFDEAKVIRSNDGASTRRVDYGGVLGPCCLRGEGVASHGENGVNWWEYEEGISRNNRLYLYMYFPKVRTQARRVLINNGQDNTAN
jgi:hypothetical protein